MPRRRSVRRDREGQVLLVEPASQEEREVEITRAPDGTIAFAIHTASTHRAEEILGRLLSLGMGASIAREVARDIVATPMRIRRLPRSPVSSWNPLPLRPAPVVEEED